MKAILTTLTAVSSTAFVLSWGVMEQNIITGAGMFFVSGVVLAALATAWKKAHARKPPLMEKRDAQWQR